MSISPDDPRLTEYALGELEGESSKQFEAAMAESPTTFDEIHEIRGAAAATSGAVASLPVRTLTDTQRHRILLLAEAPSPESLTTHPENVIRPAFWRWFGRFAAGTAAAALVVISLIFAYQSGYRNAVVDAKKPVKEKGSIVVEAPRPGETPSIRIQFLDPEGVSHPLKSDSALPVGAGSSDAIVSAVPPTHSFPKNPPKFDPGAETQDDPESNPDKGPLDDEPLPVAVVNPDGAVFPASLLENPFVEVSTSPRSSFPLHTGGESYATAAGTIRGTGRFPDPSTIAVEEVVNAFSYSVPGFVPTSSYDHPFAAGAEVFSCPWQPDHRLVRVTIKAPGQKAAPGVEPELIAEDIELLVEFNRSRAARYRLIGFDGAGILSAVGGAPPKARALYAGETVTALYEVVPPEGSNPLDDLRYTPHNFAAPPRDHGRELLCLSITYNDVSRALPDPKKSIVAPVIDPGTKWDRSSADFQFAAAAAAFGMVLSGSEHTGEFGFEQILKLAERSLRDQRNPDPKRTEFLDLVRRADRLAPRR